MAHEHDKVQVIDHTRLQLSALFDGELGMDEARFLQRRLEHDGALAARWSRWQLAGDALRGHATAVAPAGFAERVAAAVAAEPRAGAAGRSNRRFWMPGAALAASVAALAMFVTRQAPEVSAPAAPQVEIASAAQPLSANPLPAPAAPAPEQPVAPQGAAQVAAAAVAVAEVPRRAAAERRSRAQQQRAAATRAARAAPEPAAQRLVASAAPSAGSTHNPFAPEAAAGAIATKPWPRALLPDTGHAFSVGYGQLQRAPSTFQRFEPFSGAAAVPHVTIEPEDSP